MRRKATAREKHQEETLAELQRAQRAHKLAAEVRELAVDVEERAEQAERAALAAHKKLVS